jgi:hypothetical protein
MPNKASTAYGLETTEGIALRSIHQVISYRDFTDGGSAAGTYNMLKRIPAGSFVIGSKVNVLAGFTGNSSCTLAIGDSGDSNVYSANTTHNIYTAVNNLVAQAESPPVAEASANTVLLTATGASDFTAITAGKIEVWVFYFSTNPE